MEDDDKKPAKSSMGPDGSDRDAKYDGLFMAHIIIAGSLGRLSFGFDAGVMSGAELYFKDTWHDITIAQREFIISVALIAAVFGALMSGPLTDWVGRRPMIFASSFLFFMGSLIICTA